MIMKEKAFNNKQRTGNIGLFYISYKLSRLWWNVLLTSRNARGADAIIYNKAFDKEYSIQTKGFTDEEAVGPFKGKSYVAEDFYIIATFVYKCPIVYILTGEEVKENLKENKDGKYFLDKKRYLKEEFKEKWEKIGYGYSDLEESKRMMETNEADCVEK